MSRATVRAAIQAWFDPTTGSAWSAATPGPPDQLDKVWAPFPQEIDFRQYSRVPGKSTDAQAVVFLSGQSETRVTIGGAHLGLKYVTHQVRLQVFCQSEQPDPDLFMADVDTLADALHLRAVADHNFGVPDVLFQVAEAGVGLEFGEPVLDESAAWNQWFQLNFTANEFITA